MGKKLFVGNLPFSMTQSSLSNLFSEAGIVQSVTVITDPTGAPKGYAFIEDVHTRRGPKGHCSIQWERTQGTATHGGQ